MMNHKASKSNSRFLSAIKLILDSKRNGNTIDSIDDILDSNWIPRNSPIAKVIKDYAFNQKYDQNEDILEAVNQLITVAPLRREVDGRMVCDIPSNGFELPKDTNLILGKKIWYAEVGLTHEVDIKNGIVASVGHSNIDDIYDIIIYDKYKNKYLIRSESEVFVDPFELGNAVKNKFINLDNYGFKRY